MFAFVLQKVNLLQGEKWKSLPCASRPTPLEAGGGTPFDSPDPHVVQNRPQPKRNTPYQLARAT